MVLLDGLDPVSFDIELFCARLAQRRGRPIVRVPIPAAGPAQATWARGLDTDYILHAAGMSPLHRDLLVLHGIGHMLLEHLGHPAIADPAYLRILLSYPASGWVGRVFGRIVYTAEEEHAAEAFATWLLRNDERWTDIHGDGSDPDLLFRLSSVLECRDQRAGRP